MSTATTDSGSDTEVIFFTPESVEINESLLCKSKHNEFISNKDCSKVNDKNSNTNTFNFEESHNSLNINNHIKSIPKDINNFDEYTDNCNPDNTPLNDIVVKNKNKTNLCNECSHEMEDSTNSSLEFLKTDINNIKSINEITVNNNLIENDMIFNNNRYSNIIDEIENNECSLDCVQNNSLTHEKHSNMNSNNDIESNNFTNLSNLPEKMIVNHNYCKPIKLNVVTTEPYPKYTPTVEKAIKKYENKQPKKECIVM